MTTLHTFFSDEVVCKNRCLKSITLNFTENMWYMNYIPRRTIKFTLFVNCQIKFFFITSLSKLWTWSKPKFASFQIVPRINVSSNSTVPHPNHPSEAFCPVFGESRHLGTSTCQGRTRTNKRERVLTPTVLDLSQHARVWPFLLQ